MHGSQPVYKNFQALLSPFWNKNGARNRRTPSFARQGGP
jgi:hypothetical protein